MTTANEKSFLLSNARIVLAEQIVERGSLLVEGGRIARILTDESAGTALELIANDCSGLTLFPGFIDVHIHGAVGVDTLAASAADLTSVSEYLATQGVTAWLPTLVPAPLEQYQTAITSIAELLSAQREYEIGGPHAGKGSADSTLSARVLGVHYEGPFVNGEQCGALHRDHFRTFVSGLDLDVLATLSDSGAVHMMTLAPEVEGGIELVRELNRRGWIISIGHTRADIELLDRACEAGARHMTHFMNAMAPLHHRAPGPIGWGLLRDDVTCDLIADGIHLDRMTLRLLRKLKTPARLSLISDAIAAAGHGDGKYQIWGETISVSNGRTQNAGGSIAGSVISMLDAVRMMRSLGAEDVELAQMAATNPARLLRIETDCGSIAEGKRADLVALDQDGNLRFTMVGGEALGLWP